MGFAPNMLLQAVSWQQMLQAEMQLCDTLKGLVHAIWGGSSICTGNSSDLRFVPFTFVKDVICWCMLHAAFLRVTFGKVVVRLAATFD